MTLLGTWKQAQYSPFYNITKSNGGYPNTKAGILQEVSMNIILLKCLDEGWLTILIFQFLEKGKILVITSHFT